MLSWPPKIEDIVHFIAFISIKNLAYNTAKSYISAIAFQCKILDKNDVTQHFIVKKCLEGMRRLKSRSDSRLPITENILQNIILTLPGISYNKYEEKLFKAAFVTAFWGLFRVGELTMCQGKNVDQLISIDDLKLDKGHIIVLVRFSKNDQTGRGAEVKLERSGDQICPVSCLNEFLEVRPKIPGPLFCHFNGKTVTRYQFTAVLAKSLSFLGLNTHKFTSHSFRIGRASSMATQGHSSEEIMLKGRWKSTAYKGYIR